LETLGSEMTLDDTLNLIHAGLTDGARVAKEQYEGDVLMLCDWLDANPEVFAKVLTLYASALGKLFAPKTGLGGTMAQA